MGRRFLIRCLVISGLLAASACSGLASPGAPAKIISVPAQTPAPTYTLTFDSTETLPTGVNEVWAQVPLTRSGPSGVLEGSAPLKILKDDTDARFGLGCDSNMFTQIPGDFQVISARLTDSGGRLSAVSLVYSLNPTIKCNDDNSTGVNTWSQTWMSGPDSHFTACGDTLDHTGPRPVITANTWTITGATATSVCKSATELTTVTLAPVK